MYNVDKIEININNIFNAIDVLIIPDALKAYKDGKEISITKDYIKRLLRIICLWDKQNNSNQGLDSSSYDIRIYSEGKDTELTRKYNEIKEKRDIILNNMREYSRRPSIFNL